MKTILDIFKFDIHSLTKNIFALALVIGIGVFPALYAWINLYATNDPYVNTGNVRIAVASEDPGLDWQGEHVNASADVLTELKDNHDIGWTPVRTSEAAIEGVRAGDYYAAIVFEKNFTYDMYHIEEAMRTDDPPITYYSNNKKNAVAPKITDMAANSLLQTINRKYLRTLFSEAFAGAGEEGSELTEDMEDTEEDVLTQLKDARAAVHDFNGAITQMASGTKDIRRSLKDAENSLDSKRSQARSDAKAAKKQIKRAKKTINKVSKQISSEQAQLRTAISELEKAIASLDPSDENSRQDALDNTCKVLVILETLRSTLPEEPSTQAGKTVAVTLDLMITQTKEIRKALTEDGNVSSETVETLKKLLDEDLDPAFALLSNDLKRALKLAQPLISSGRSVLDDIDPVLEGAGKTVSALDKTLLAAQPMLLSMEERLDDVIERVEAADEEDRADILADFLGGDGDRYAKFITSFVEVESHQIYRADTFGAGMVPFYTAIALWVGGVMLIAMLQTNIDRRRFRHASEVQGFFGRFLIFFFVGQIQAAVTLGGEIFLFGCEPVHPWLMYFAAAMTALVFDILIYALVLAFGNIGKAIVIVLMVLQIAGSSGTFPLELLPKIFTNIYLFFPFPYAINAMREGLAGLYGHDYLIYLAQLSIFAVIGIIIGIFARRPFAGVDRFVTEKMEETEVL